MPMDPLNAEVESQMRAKPSSETVANVLDRSFVAEVEEHQAKPLMGALCALNSHTGIPGCRTSIRRTEEDKSCTTAKDAALFGSNAILSRGEGVVAVVCVCEWEVLEESLGEVMLDVAS